MARISVFEKDNVLALVKKRFDISFVCYFPVRISRIVKEHRRFDILSYVGLSINLFSVFFIIMFLH
jgi:hypothetical protein